MIETAGSKGRITRYFTYFSGDPIIRRNILNNIWDGAWYSVMVGLTTSFMGVYLLALGGSDSMLGLLSSLPALVTLVAQFPAAMITERRTSRLHVVVPFGLAFRFGYLLFALIPFLPIPAIYRAWLFVLLLSLINFPGTVSGVAWTAMMGDIFPGELRGRIFSDRNMLLGIVQLSATLLAGPLLDKLPYPYNFSLVFSLSFVALLISTRYLRRIIERPATKELPGARRRGLAQWQGTGAALRDRGFLMFMVAMFIVHSGFNVSNAMWTILYVRVIGLSRTFIGLLSVFSQVMSVLSYRWWGRLADRVGYRLALFISILGFVPQPWLHSFVRTAWPLVPLSLLSGFTGAGFNLILFNALLGLSPDERTRPSYIAVFNTAINLTACLAPVIGVAIYQAAGMSVVFGLASSLRLAGLLFLVWKVGLRAPGERKRKAMSTKEA